MQTFQVGREWEGQTDLMNNAIPGKSSIVDNDMNLSAAEFSRLFN